MYWFQLFLLPEFCLGFLHNFKTFLMWGLRTIHPSLTEHAQYRHYFKWYSNNNKRHVCWMVFNMETSFWGSISLNFLPSHQNKKPSNLWSSSVTRTVATSSESDVWCSSLWFCLSFLPQSWPRSVSDCHTHCPSLPITPPSNRSPPPSSLPSFFSSQWLYLVPAFFPLRGFLCFLGCQVNSGMSGSF